MSIDHPKVTVLMPVYNGEKYLREAIDSVMNQTFTDFELLILNDGSTDDSLEIMKAYDDPRIRLIQNDDNLGLVATRNKGLSNARGEHIALLDCDDIAYPERLAKQVDFLDRHPEFGMIGSWIEVIDQKSRPTGEVVKHTACPEEISPLLLFHNYFAQSSLMIRKSALPDEHYRLYPVAEDYDLWVRMAKKSMAWNLPKFLVKYRVHSFSTTSENTEEMEKCVRQIISEQLNMIELKPTAYELDIHRSIENLSFSVNVEFLKAAETWLKKILDANNRIRFYESSYLERCLAEKWFLICTQSTRLGWQVWRLFWQSPVSRLSRLSLSSKAKFLKKCLLK